MSCVPHTDHTTAPFVKRTVVLAVVALLFVLPGAVGLVSIV